MSRARTPRTVPPVKAAKRPLVAVKTPPRPPSPSRSVKAKGPRSEVVTITPTLAEEWLGKNSHNRSLRSGRVEQIAGAISRGEWQFNGDAIRWNEDGTVLLDGQHRLWAVIESNTPIVSLVVWGINASAQETMDLGAKRSLRDVLDLRGEKSSSALAAVTNMIWKRQQGEVRGSALPTITQAVKLFESDADAIRQALRTADSFRKRFHVSQAVAGSFVYEVQAIDYGEAEFFVQSLVSGENLTPGSPVLAMRRWLERQSMAGVSQRASVPMVYAIFIKAWNAYRDGKLVEQLTWRPTGKTPEAFPDPR